MVTKLRAVSVLVMGALMLLAVGNEGIGASESLDSGQFVTVDPDHRTTGTVEILQKKNRVYVRLAEDFSTAEGPDVNLLLHKKNPPKGFNQGDYVTLGELKSFNGTQAYQVPEGVALDEYNSVVVWCKKFNIVFGAAHLEHLAGKVGAMDHDRAMTY